MRLAAPACTDNFMRSTVRPTSESKRRVAIIGGGAAGMAAAYLLQATHAVTLFEARDRLGGHVHTVTLEQGADRGLKLDLGFMVYNTNHYPLFCNWLKALGNFESAPAEMSFSYHEPDTGFHYALNFGASEDKPLTEPPDPSTDAAQKNLRSLINEIVRFTRQARRDLCAGRLEDLTLGAYLDQACSPELAARYVIPMAAGLWSTPSHEVTAFSAGAVIRFYENHGILSFQTDMQWQALRGGSHRYVAAFQNQFPGELRLGCPVQAVHRSASDPKVWVTLPGAEKKPEPFDQVILATHADQALALLTDATEEERRVLSAWQYSRSHGILHTDESVLPPSGSQAAWNFTHDAASPGHYSMTYDLNRLQPLGDTQHRYLFSLERQAPINESAIIGEVPFTHPSYPLQAERHQQALRRLNQNNPVVFCGSYLGAGFHEDAVRSGMEAAQTVGAQLPADWEAEIG